MRKSNVVLTASILLFGTAAWGQGVGGGSPTQTTHLLLSAAGIPENPPLDWLAKVGSGTLPVAVELDESGPEWLASFHTETGAPIAQNRISMIDEYLLVQGTLPWTGWQMEIVSNGFDWSTRILPRALEVIVNGDRAPGLQVYLVGSVAQVSFDPIAPGTMVRLMAFIVNEGEPASTFQIQQFPTPEPSTLLGFLLLAPLIRRR